MAVAILDAGFVITAVSDEYVAQVTSKEASVGSSFLDVFEEEDWQVISDALARTAHGSMEKVDGVRVLSRGPRPSDSPRNAVHDWTLLQHNDGFLAAAVPAAGVIGAAGTAGTPSLDAGELKDFLNKAPVALHCLSPSGKVLWANDRELELLGYSKEEYIGADVVSFCPDARDDDLAPFKQLGLGNTIRDAPVRFRTRSGTVVDLLMDSVASYESDGSLDHTWCFFRDDTGRKVREAQAEAAATAAKKYADGKRRFSSILLHNIRTPLHIVTMHLSDPAAVDAPVLKSQLRSLSGLCTSVAQAMKLGDGSFVTLLPTPTNLSSLVREYRKPEGVQHEVVVEEIGFNESLHVLVDGKMVRMVLDELIALADERNPAGVPVALHVERKRGMYPGRGDDFEFRVVDKGGKLDESRVEKAFYNYWLGDEGWSAWDEERSSMELSSGGGDAERIRELSSCGEGPSLRLNVAFNCVQCLNSILLVDSDAATTTFKFALVLETSSVLQQPRADAEALRGWPGIFRAPSCPGAGFFGPPCKQVLIVEDNTICQKICKRIVTGLGHTADTANNGAIAVEMATKGDASVYDMVLMDLRMPVMDGITAAVKIHEVFPELPIVAFSAEESDKTHIEALNVMVAFLRKPATAKEVKRTIEEHARRPSTVSFLNPSLQKMLCCRRC